jgi:hypothetical protein
MRSWILSLVGALALAASPALANNVNDIIMPATGGTTYFAAIHADDFDFTDIFLFAAEGPLEVSASLVTIGSGASNIDFLSADLNGVALTLSPQGFLETGATEGTLSLVGPLTLTVHGKSSAAGGTFASYAGTMNVASGVLVPEPATLALTLAGLGCLALSTPRRTRPLR